MLQPRILFGLLSRWNSFLGTSYLSDSMYSQCHTLFIRGSGSVSLPFFTSHGVSGQKVPGNNLQSAVKYGDCQKRLLLTSPSSSTPISIKQAREELKVYVGSSKSFGEDRVGISDVQAPTKQSDLPPRHMLDSYREACIPVGSDEKLREKYVNFHGTIRFGRVMEDLDTMAVWTSYTHYHDPGNQGGKCPLSIVTAGVDRMDMKTSHMKADKDIFLRSHVTHVGTTSLEVTIVVEQDDGTGTQKEILEAKFLMVARDPKNKGKMPVNSLLVESPEEKRLFQQGEDGKAQRMKEKQINLLTSPPSGDERLLAHDLFKSTLNPKSHTFRKPVLPDRSVWMEDTIMKNVHISFPEQRNLYNKIFGGYLMRAAYELGWICAVLHGKTRHISIEAVDDILFRSPVEIGSLLFLSSQVVYTEGKYVQVRAHAEVVDPQTQDHKTTNVFHYTFSVPHEVASVMPKSYAEYMMYLDGKRHFDEAMRFKKQP